MDDLVERYLHAIEFWLPKAQRADIIAEISEDLLAQIDDRRAALGRELQGSELEALLKERGRPMLVANHYRPQRSLVGPVLFPTYIFVLKIIGLFYLVPWFVVFLVLRRVQQPAPSWSTTILAAVGSLWSVAFMVAGVVTLVFAVLEAYGLRTTAMESWNPRDLPPARNPRRIPLYDSVADLVANLIFLLWWIDHFSSPVVFHGGSIALSLAPLRVYFFWGFLSVALFRIGLAAYNLFRPYWTSLRATFRLLSDLLGVSLFCLLLRSNLIATLTIANLDPARTLAIESAIRLCMLRAFPIAVILAVVLVAVDLSRLVHIHRRGRVLLNRGFAARSTPEAPLQSNKQ